MPGNNIKLLDSGVVNQIRVMQCPQSTIDECPDYRRLAQSTLPPLCKGILTEVNSFDAPPQRVKELMYILFLALGLPEEQARVCGIQDYCSC